VLAALGGDCGHHHSECHRKAARDQADLNDPARLFC
jgi:hypothetical protein